MTTQLRINPIMCDGHGMCAELLPELIEMDEWGYPVVHGDLPPQLRALAERAVAACPTLALLLVEDAGTRTRRKSA